MLAVSVLSICAAAEIEIEADLMGGFDCVDEAIGGAASPSPGAVRQLRAMAALEIVRGGVEAYCADLFPAAGAVGKNLPA